MKKTFGHKPLLNTRFLRKPESQRCACYVRLDTIQVHRGDCTMFLCRSEMLWACIIIALDHFYRFWPYNGSYPVIQSLLKESISSHALCLGRSKSRPIFFVDAWLSSFQGSHEPHGLWGDDLHEVWNLVWCHLWRPEVMGQNVQSLILWFILFTYLSKVKLRKRFSYDKYHNKALGITTSKLLSKVAKHLWPLP